MYLPADSLQLQIALALLQMLLSLYQHYFLFRRRLTRRKHVIQDGGCPLGLGLLNIVTIIIVGQGNAGKTAFARQLEGLCFQDMANNWGMAQQLLEVTCAALDVGDSNWAWRRGVGCNES